MGQREVTQLWAQHGEGLGMLRCLCAPVSTCWAVCSHQRWRHTGICKHFSPMRILKPNPCIRAVCCSLGAARLSARVEVRSWCKISLAFPYLSQNPGTDLSQAHSYSVTPKIEVIDAPGRDAEIQKAEHSISDCTLANIQECVDSQESTAASKVVPSLEVMWSKASH